MTFDANGVVAQDKSRNLALVAMKVKKRKKRKFEKEQREKRIDSS